MPLLVGRYVNKIDRKGRVSVPKAFRDALLESPSGFAGIYAYPSFKMPAIEACGEARMQQLADSIDDVDMFSDEHEKLASTVLENAHQLPFDPEGRVVLPTELLDHAAISGEAVFVGRGARFAIWNPAAFTEHRDQAFARAREGGATLRLRRPREGTP
jgi:MraZ protein